MKAFIASLLFLALLGIRAPASFAQQNQNYQKLAQELEVLKTQLSAVQSQLQTVENVEKIELKAKLADAQTKLTDANAKLMNAEFEKFERNLKDSNDKWLFGWTGFFGLIIAVTLTIIGVAFWFSIKSMIEDRVEKNLIGFKEGLAQVDTLKNEFKEAVDTLENRIRVLDKEHAAHIVERFMHYRFKNEDSHHAQIKELQEEALLDLFRDETRHPDLIKQTVRILAHRKSVKFVPSALEFLNSTLDSHPGEKLSFPITGQLRLVVSGLEWIPTQETCEGLTKLLNRLLREPTEHYIILAVQTISSIAEVSPELNKEDWLSLLKPSISHLDNNPETMMTILTRLPDDLPDLNELEDCLLDLLEKHDTEFVNNFREQKANANTKTAAN